MVIFLFYITFYIQWINILCIFNLYLTDRLPFSIRVLLESAVRNCDNFQVTKSDVEKILDWENNQTSQDGVEVAFKPARVILQVKKAL